MNFCLLADDPMQSSIAKQASKMRAYFKNEIITIRFKMISKTKQKKCFGDSRHFNRKIERNVYVNEEKSLSDIQILINKILVYINT